MPAKVRIVSIAYDPPGWDVDGEHVIIRNDGDASADLGGWTLEDAAGHVFTFPPLTLPPGSSVRVWTKAGANDAANLFWGRNQAVWNNRPGDTAILRNAAGNEVHRYRYGLAPGQRIVVPAFFDRAHLPDFQEVPPAAPTVALAVLDLNVWQEPLPPSLSDPAVLQNFRNLIQGYQAAKIRVLGYVPTDGGTGSNPSKPLHTSGTRKDLTVAQINGWADRWYTLFAPATPDGIFLDEGPEPFRFNGRDTPGPPVADALRAFYVDLFGHVHTYDGSSSEPQIVMLNAAFYTENVDWVLGTGAGLSSPAADIALLWEETAAKYLQTGPPPNHYPDSPPSWWTDPAYVPDRIAHTVYACALDQLCDVVMLSKQRGAGYVYVYEGNSAAYNHLPPYWSEEVTAVREGCTPAGGATTHTVVDVAVAPLSDDRLELWLIDAGGGLSSTWKTTTNPNATWTALVDFLAEVGPLPAGARQVAVAPLSDERLELWVSDGAGGLSSCWKTTTNPNAPWTGWSNFLDEVGGIPGGTSALSVAPLPDDRLQLWAVDGIGGLWSCWKTAANANAAWSGWNDFLGEAGGLPTGARQAAVAPLPDGRLELWVVDAAGGVSTTWKLATNPNSGWAPWSDFLAEVGGLPAGARDVCVAPLPDGRLELWVSDAGGGLSTCWKLTTNPNSAWSPWNDFLGEVGDLPGGAAALAVAPLADGRLELWAVTTSGDVWSCWKTTTNPNSGWTAWSDFLAEVNGS